MSTSLKSGIGRAISRFVFNIDRIEQKYARIRPLGTVVELCSMRLLPGEGCKTEEEFEKAVQKTEKILELNKFGESHVSCPIAEFSTPASVEKCMRVNMAFEKKLANKGIIKTAEKEAEKFESYLARERQNHLVCRKRRIEAEDDGTTKRLKLSQEEHFVSYRTNANGGISKEVTAVYDRMIIQPQSSFVKHCSIKPHASRLMIEDGKSLCSEALSENHYVKQFQALKNTFLPVTNQVLGIPLLSVFNTLAFKPLQSRKLIPKYELQNQDVTPTKKSYMPLKAIKCNSDQLTRKEAKDVRTVEKKLEIRKLIADDVISRANCERKSKDHDGCSSSCSVEFQKQTIIRPLFQNDNKTEKRELQKLPTQKDCNYPIVEKRDFSLRKTPAREKFLKRRELKKGLPPVKEEENKIRFISWLDDASRRTREKDFEEDSISKDFERKFRRLKCGARMRNMRLKQGYIPC